MRLEADLLGQRQLLLALVCCLTATRVIVVVESHFDSAHVTADVKLFGELSGLVNVVLGVLLAASAVTLLLISIIGCRLLRARAGFAAGVLAAGLQDDGVHAVHWGTSLVLPREEFLAPDGARYDVTDQRVSLWQVSREVHLLPTARSRHKQFE